MAPDTQTVKQASGAYPRVLSGANRYAIYLDGDGPSDVTLLLPQGRYSGQWIDIRTGARQPLEIDNFHGEEKTIHSPPFQNGIALELSKVGD
jgi:hypothetical protein